MAIFFLSVLENFVRRRCGFGAVGTSLPESTGGAVAPGVRGSWAGRSTEAEDFVGDVRSGATVRRRFGFAPGGVGRGAISAAGVAWAGSGECGAAGPGEGRSRGEAHASTRSPVCSSRVWEVPPQTASSDLRSTSQQCRNLQSLVLHHFCLLHLLQILCHSPPLLWCEPPLIFLPFFKCAVKIWKSGDLVRLRLGDALRGGTCAGCSACRPAPCRVPTLPRRRGKGASPSKGCSAG